MYIKNKIQMKLRRFLTTITRELLNERLVLGKNERVHLSKTPIQNIEIKSKNKDVLGKPSGLWYGFGSNWINFKKYGVTWDTKDNTSLKDVMKSDVYIYKLYLDTSKILTLDTEDSYINFTRQYSTNTNYPYNIDWDLVSKKYKGIEFPNYEDLDVRNLHRKSKEYEWIYSIDINSGCIWDGSAVKKHRLL